VSKHDFLLFEELVSRVKAQKLSRWSDIEADFISVVEKFDSEYSAGGREPGWYQSKARYFNDAIVALLSNASGREVSLRTKKDSQLFDKIDVDICYPASGTPRIAGEVKALGTPPHSGNRGKARGGSSDIHKRLREVAFTSTDLKVAYSGPQPIRSFQNWIDSTEPGYFSFWAIRAGNDSDLERVRSMISSLRSYCNGVAAVLYLPASPETPTDYQVRHIPELDIDRALREMAQRVS
jgi:hypothetical protein